MDLVESGDVEAIRSETPRSAGGGSDTCVCVCVCVLSSCSSSPSLFPPSDLFHRFLAVRVRRGLQEAVSTVSIVGVPRKPCASPCRPMQETRADGPCATQTSWCRVACSSCSWSSPVAARSSSRTPRGHSWRLGGGRGARPCRGIHRGAKWLRNYHRSRGPLGTFLGPSWNLIWALLGPFLGPSWIPWSPKRGPGQGARARDPRCNRGQGRMGGPYSLRAPAGTSPQVPALHREGPSVQAFHAHEVFQWRLREGALAVQQSARHRPARQVRPQGSHAQAARRRADSRWPERQAPSPCLGRPLIVGARGA